MDKGGKRLLRIGKRGLESDLRAIRWETEARRIKQEDTLSLPPQFTLTMQLVGFSKILVPLCQITHRRRRPYVCIYRADKL
jgi:hypothetical protein